MDELEMKARVLNELRRRRRLSKRSLVASEFCLGKSIVRADLAILGSCFLGVEIKSAKDTLRRLHGQLESYRRHFDEIILVISQKHLPKIDSSLLLGLELWVMDSTGSIEVKEFKIANGVDQIDLHSLLTKTECQRYLKSRLVEHSPEVNHAIIGSLTLRDAFRKAFRARFGETTRKFWLEVGQREVRPDDLGYLSRFRAQREEIARLRHERAQQWEMWAYQIHTF
jgi:hypothetical protein